MNHHTRLTAALTLAIAGTLTAGPAAATAPATGNQLVAIHEDGSQAAAKSYINGSAQVASAGGRWVVFSTEAPLVEEDTNGRYDVYLRDTVAGTTTLVSAAGATLANGDSFEPTISADAGRIAFTTTATNLFRDRNRATLDVVVKDMESGEIRVVSRGSDGRQMARNSFFPVISGDGGHVAFQTFNPFGGRDHDSREDVYVHRLRNGMTRQVSLSERGRDLPGRYVVGDISDDGRMVTFGDDNNAWVRDMDQAHTTRFWHEPNDPHLPYSGGTVGRPVISGDGRVVAFTTRNRYVAPGDHGHHCDVFRLNLRTGRFVRVSVAPRSRVANGESFIPSLSRTGRFVGFSSFADNLVPEEAAGSNVYVRDMRTRTTYLASVGPDGRADGQGGRTAVAISPDGRTLVYESYASDLVAEDTNGWADVFAWRMP